VEPALCDGLNQAPKEALNQAHRGALTEALHQAPREALNPLERRC
jgi:hypothetical protein